MGTTGMVTATATEVSIRVQEGGRDLDENMDYFDLSSKVFSCERKCLLHLNRLTLGGIFTVNQLLLKQFVRTGQKQPAY